MLRLKNTEYSDRWNLQQAGSNLQQRKASSDPAETLGPRQIRPIQHHRPAFQAHSSQTIHQEDEPPKDWLPLSPAGRELERTTQNIDHSRVSNLAEQNHISDVYNSWIKFKCQPKNNKLWKIWKEINWRDILCRFQIVHHSFIWIKFVYGKFRRHRYDFT